MVFLFEFEFYLSLAGSLDTQDGKHIIYRHLTMSAPQCGHLTRSDPSCVFSCRAIADV